jgi:uncharacterized protein (TIRG00374 family)
MWLIRQWKLLATVLLFGVLFSQVEDLGELWSAVARTSWTAMLAAVVLNTADRFLMTYKWLRLLSARGVHVPTLDGMKIYCASMIWGQLLPSGVGADAIRAYSTTRYGAPAQEVLASIVIERLGGLLATAAAAAAGLLLLGGAARIDARLVAVWWVSAAMVVGAVMVVLAATSRRLFEWVERVFGGRRWSARASNALTRFHLVLRSYGGHGRELVVFLALTAVQQLSGVIITLVLALGMGIQVSWVYVIAGVPIASLFARLPVSLGGLGVYEGVFALVLGAGGVSLSEALVLSLSYRVAEVASWLPWWIMYTRGSGSLRRPGAEAEVPG